jgi:biopolymer transport protein ExbD
VPDVSVYVRAASYRQKHDSSVQDVIIEGGSDARSGDVLLAMAAACEAGFSEFGLANRARGKKQIGETPPGFQKELPRCLGRAATSEVQKPVVRSKSWSPPAIDKRSILVEISSADATWIDGHRAAADHLYEIMNHAVRFHETHHGFRTHISLIADAKSSWQAIITVLDAARQAGDDDVGIVTQ